MPKYRDEANAYQLMRKYNLDNTKGLISNEIIDSGLDMPIKELTEKEIMMIAGIAPDTLINELIGNFEAYHEMPEFVSSHDLFQLHGWLETELSRRGFFKSGRR